MAFPGGPGSAGGAAAVEEGGEGGEDHQERDGPQQRGGYRVLHGPGRDGGRGIGVAPQVAGGGGDHDRDTYLVSASLRRISDEASHLASAPCVLPRAAVSRRP